MEQHHNTEDAAQRSKSFLWTAERSLQYELTPHVCLTIVIKFTNEKMAKESKTHTENNDSTQKDLTQLRRKRKAENKKLCAQWLRNEP